MAFSLSPRDGATGVTAVPVLSWLAGDTAVTFNVYFGTDSSAVTAGDASALLGRQAEKSVTLASALTWGGKYYWKVDAVTAGGTILPGIVSSFTVTDRIVLEGFESYDVTPVEPNPAGLVGWWQFDGNLNSVGGKGQTGVPFGTIGFEADPVRGQVLDLPGGDNQYVALGGVGISGKMPRTIAVWAKADNTNIPDWTLVFGFTGDAAGNGGNGSHFDIDSLGGPGGVGAHVWGWEETIFTDQQALQWRHYAMSYDGTTIQYYGDGKLMDTDPAKSNVQDLSLSADRVHVGKRITQASSFPGNVDDARIYNYTLSPAEVAGVAGLVATAPLGNTWVGSGTATAVLTLSGPHAGAKAMNIQYQNGVAPYIGEVSAVPSITNMTQGAGSLLLWVRGDAANGADPIYVALDDSAGVSAVVTNSDPLASQDGNWTPWIIPLNKFAGVNLASVAKLSIGVGNGQLGGAGAIRIDDIALVKPVIITVPADVTAPGDYVRGVPNDGVNTGGNTAGWPAAEAPPFAIDNNVNTKLLHFKGDVEPTGIQVTPSGPQSIVTGLTFTTANDTAGRDPIAFELSGSNVGINGPYQLIAAGRIVDFNQPAEWPRLTKNTTPISFVNTVAYDHYQLIFPAIRGPVGGGVNSMQIAEVELIGTVGFVPPLISAVVRANGQTGNRAPIGTYDGGTAPLATEPGGLKDGNLVFSDRTFTWASVPAEYVGTEYIRTFNSDKGTSELDVTYTVTISRPAIVWITADDRIPAEWNYSGAVLTQQAAVNLATAAFAAPGTFADTGINLFIRENATTDRPMSVYAAPLPAGTYVFGIQPSNKNFYSIGAVE
jgi:hypothetical protein